MKDKISVIVKRPRGIPEQVTVPNTLEAFQDLVGGYIECVTIDDFCVVCDEEGLLKNLPFNCIVHGNPFVGPIVFAGIDGEDFADCPLSLDEFDYQLRLEEFQELYRSVTEV